VKSERRYFNLGILMRDFDEERDPIEVQHVQPCRRFDLPLTRFIRAAALGKSDDDAAA
jgi:hypothetical protein